MSDELAQLQEKNIKLEAELQQARLKLAEQQLEVALLHQFDREMARSSDINFILEYGLNWVMERTEAQHGLIAKWVAERRYFQVLISQGQPMGEIHEVGKMLELPDHLKPETTIEDGDAELLFSEDKRCLVADLRQPDMNLIGVLLLQRSDREFNFKEDEKYFTKNVANRLAISLHQTTLLNNVQALNQHRARLFRLLSHDLRQPLTVLMGYIQLADFALKQNNTEVLGGYIEQIGKGASDLSDLLEEVLLLDRLQEIRRNTWETISLNQVCERALEKHYSMISLKGHKLEIDFTDEDARFRGLSLYMREAVSNLISNAVKYTPDKGQIKLRLWGQDNRWYFEIIDSGYGISPDKQPHVFEPFFRAQEPGTQDIKGTGLGLNLVKEIIEQHGGDVYLQSEPGKGSTFGFWVPKPQTAPLPAD
ncbi:MAG: GAF domain-containing sensor histidine kinase [Anaerolineae bacterium]|nr:GAF domain-containing sensor histidine kinase [Anaerolineae bacterium]